MEVVLTQHLPFVLASDGRIARRENSSVPSQYARNNHTCLHKWVLLGEEAVNSVFPVDDACYDLCGEGKGRHFKSYPRRKGIPAPFAKVRPSVWFVPIAKRVARSTAIARETQLVRPIRPLGSKYSLIRIIDRAKNSDPFRFRALQHNMWRARDVTDEVNSLMRSEGIGVLLAQET